ncbi:MAG: hypothetical protein ACI4VN_06955 [Clostridia bacterium]
MNREEVLELIELGFEPELINLEFSVPIEKIKKFIDQDKKRKAKEVETKAKLPESSEDLEKKKNSAMSSLSKNRSQKHLTPIIENQTKSHPEIVQTPRSFQTTAIPQAKTTQVSGKKSNTTRMETIRERYKNVYVVNQESLENSENLTKIKQPTPEQEQQINDVIDVVEKKSKQFDTLTVAKAKKDLLYTILDDIQSISNLPKTLEQLITLNKLLSEQKFENIILTRNQNPNAKLNRSRKLINTQLLQLIDELALQTSDLSELRSLQQVAISSRLRTGVDIFADATRGRIENKIGKIQVQSAMDNIRNNVSSEIQELVCDIANDTFDEEKSRTIIELEAKRRLNTAPKNRFALTQERHAKQVEIQIRTLLSEQGDKYPIQNPGSAMNSLMALSPDLTKDNAFRIVIENLIVQGKTQVAHDLCDKYIMARKYGVEETSISKLARQLKRKIIFSQIGNMVLEQIKKPSNPEEDDMFMDMLESRLSAEKISLSQIAIGRNQTGVKKITLADIWYKAHTIQK